MSKEYLEAQFRRYFPDAKAIDVNFLEDQEKTVVDVTLPVSASAFGQVMFTFVCEAGSDDDFFVFEDINDGRIVTVPFEPEAVEPVWRTNQFTEQERSNMVTLLEEEVRDSVNEYAIEMLDSMGPDEMTELVAYADDDPGTTAELLHAIADFNAGMDDYRSGDHEDHVKRAEFMTRHGLVDKEDRITDLGRKFMEAYG